MSTDLTALRALEAATTPGPWRPGVAIPHDPEWVHSIHTVADSAFIAAARNALPELIDRLEAAEAERDRLRAGIEALADECEVWADDDDGYHEMADRLRALAKEDS
jgi:hypothetical protein